MKDLFDDLDEKEVNFYVMERMLRFYRIFFYEDNSVSIYNTIKNEDDDGRVTLLSNELSQITRLAKLFSDRRENRRLKEKRILNDK